MTKKVIIWKIIFTLMLFSVGADAALQWKVGAFIGTFAGGVAIAIGLAGAAPIVVAGTLAIGAHAAVIGLYWDDVNPPMINSIAASSGLSVVIDANTPFLTPVGWTPPNTGQKEPQPPQTTQLKNLFTSTVSPSYTQKGITNLVLAANTPEALYTAILSQTNYSEFNPYAPYENSGYFSSAEDPYFNVRHADAPIGANYYDSIPFTVSTTCDSGYTRGVDNRCHLTTATNVKKPTDDVCEVSIDAGVFRPSANDPDCNKTAVLGLGTSTLTAATTNKSVYLAASPSGTVTVYEKTYNPSNNTTSLSTANFNGSSDLDFIQTANSLGNNVGINPAGGGTGSGNNSTSDAKDSSLNVKDGGDEPIGSGDTSGVQAPSDTLKTSFNPLKNWLPPAIIGTCPVGVFDVFNRIITLDSHCTIFNANASTISQAMGVVFSISALFIVLAA